MNCEEESDVIDLDEYQPTAKRQRVPKTWVKADDIILSEVDEKDISSGGWLSDNVINACQNLLRRQYPHIGGLLSTVLATTFSMEPQAGEFVQILNVGECHWVTISTIGCPASTVKVYDSLHMKISSRTKKLIADLLMTQEKSIAITHTNVQWQSGSSDCGLFALVFATSLCQGNDPVNISYDQQQMRRHLLQCIGRGTISAFPQRSGTHRTTKTSSSHIEIVPVFCICRLPDNGETMVQCSSC